MSDCSGFILLYCLSPITCTGHHLTLPSTSCSPEIPLHFPSQSPGNKPAAPSSNDLHDFGNITPQLAQGEKDTTTATHRPPGGELCLFSRSRRPNFRNVKANGRGESRAASVCLLHFVPALAPSSLRPIQRGSDYRPAAEDTRAPVSQSADHNTSTHPSTIARSGSGTGLTDHRTLESPNVRFWGRNSWGRQENKNRQHELPSVSRLLLILSWRPISRTTHHDTIASPSPSAFYLWT